ncbi:hypothetical protein DC366_14265 [Pelagivirga sediminicola]|uniref:Uncharacterized protein n=1 Tax=Pelagivirga sediminicola TaxID=2170575 RepID=A0A2T7G4H3_9RHOB|nr:hypothetical protein [Pelagivirga sediminicola]PVA09290.1 hypothetical protein DC366_14265 [Pelagivirga sediminicola]
MEMLAAMFCGAVGGAALRRGALALPVATVLGIIAGAAAWYLLGLVGPGLKAGPLASMHAAAGAAAGAGLAALAGAVRRRAGG